MTRVVTPSLLGGLLINLARAGIPKANVLPLPVSAIPTTSRPSRAGGQAHAWMGVGAGNWVSGARRLSGMGSWVKVRYGVMDGVQVMLCVVRKLVISDSVVVFSTLVAFFVLFSTGSKRKS